MKATRLLVVLGLLCAVFYSKASIGDEVSCEIAVDAGTRVGTFNRLVSGNNLNWVNFGDGIFDPAAGAVKPAARDKIRELGVSVLRFPGGNLAEYYDWKAGLGDRAARKNGLDYEKKPQKMDFGLDDFLGMCESLGIAPILTVGYFNTTPAGAAELVEYVNGPVSSPMGALRSRNGHPKPYRVAYWEIGNEVYFKGITAEKAAAYGKKTNEMALAMKKVDPSIKVGAIGLGVSLVWDEAVLRECADNVDYLVYHRYFPNRTSNDAEELNRAVIVSPEKMAREIRRLRQTAARFNPKLKVAVTEFNLDFRDANFNSINKPSDVQQALYIAECLRLFQLNDVLLATKWDMAHASRHFMSDINFNRGAGITLAPSFYTEKLFAHLDLESLVEAKVKSPTVSVLSFGEIKNENNVPLLTALAGKNADGHKLSLVVINRDLKKPYSVKLRIDGFGGVKKIDLFTLKAAPGGAADHFVTVLSGAKPEAFRDIVVPPGSVSLYQIYN